MWALQSGSRPHSGNAEKVAREPFPKPPGTSHLYLVKSDLFTQFSCVTEWKESNFTVNSLLCTLSK